MDVFEVLKKDHEEARQIFGKIQSLPAGARKTREDLFQKLKEELLRHAKAEEKIFYPKLRDEKPTHDLIEEAYSEHHQVEKMLKEIETMPVGGDDWMKAVMTLKEKVEHHVREEENDIFPKARKMLKENQVSQLGDEVQRAKRH